MDYREYLFQIDSKEEFHKDLLINALSGFGFDTFEDAEGGFKAYIPIGEDNSYNLKNIADEFSDMFSFTFQVTDIPHQNWNEVWESNFEPLRINDRCYIRATFHEPHPEYEFEIVVDPKMAFGTGHHQTTAMMMELMLDIDFKGQKVLDMGCGTGILAILASFLGAQDVVAIDYDPISYESAIENSNLNGVKNITAICGSKEAIPDEKFEIILANINRNILLDQMDRYAETLNTKGTILFSGFYFEPDLDIIKEKATSLGLRFVEFKQKDSWVAAKFSLELKVQG